MTWRQYPTPPKSTMFARTGESHRDMPPLRWLALEVLMTDPMALEDDALQERLILLQDKIEEKARLSA
jgi:hypothetical protein